MATRKGVERDLSISPFIYEVIYDDDKIEFVFSSKINYNKFNARILNNRINISKSLSHRFKMNINLDILADIVLYQKIEHRGFLIKVNNEVIEWLNIIILDGKIRILKN